MLIYILASLLWLSKCMFNIYTCIYNRLLKLRQKPNSSCPIKTYPSHGLHRISKAIPSLHWLGQSLGFTLFSLALTSLSVRYWKMMSALLKNISIIQSLLTTPTATVMVQATTFPHLDKHKSCLTRFLVCVLSLSSLLVNRHWDSLKI